MANIKMDIKENKAIYHEVVELLQEQDLQEDTAFDLADEIWERLDIEHPYGRD